MSRFDPEEVDELEELKIEERDGKVYFDGCGLAEVTLKEIEDYNFLYKAADCAPSPELWEKILEHARKLEEMKEEKETEGAEAEWVRRYFEDKEKKEEDGSAVSRSQEKPVLSPPR